VNRIIVHTDMGAVHDLHDLPIDTAGIDPYLFPQGHALFRGPSGEPDGTLLFAELRRDRLGQIDPDFCCFTTLGLDAVLGCQGLELGLVLDLISPAFSLGRQEEGVGDIPAVIGMGRRACRNHADKAARHDNIGRGPAHSCLGAFAVKGADAAGPHVAVSAADPQFTETTLGQLGLIPVPGRLKAQFPGPLQHLVY